jgi:hypothetical protein
MEADWGSDEEREREEMEKVAQDLYKIWHRPSTSPKRIHLKGTL